VFGEQFAPMAITMTNLSTDKGPQIWHAMPGRPTVHAIGHNTKKISKCIDLHCRKHVEGFLSWQIALSKFLYRARQTQPPCDHGCFLFTLHWHFRILRFVERFGARILKQLSFYWIIHSASLTW
jgi:hypothetical protein